MMEGYLQQDVNAAEEEEPVACPIDTRAAKNKLKYKAPVLIIPSPSKKSPRSARSGNSKRVKLSE